MKPILPDLRFDPDATHVEGWDGDWTGDTARCSCGWRSNVYWDGEEFAHDEWVQHVNGYHVYVVSFPGYNCKCHEECEETFATVDVRRLELELEEARQRVGR